MFQKIKFYNGQDPAGWQPFLNDLSKDNAKGILLFVGEETPFDYKQLQPILKALDIEVWGCITPEVIYNGSLYKQGVVGCAFKSPVSVEVIKDLAKFKRDLLDDFSLESTRSLLVFTDAYSDNIPLLIESLFEKEFKEIAFIGGSVGSTKNINYPSLFTKDDFFAGGAIILAVEDFISVGISHGSEPISEPAVATSVDKKVIKSINFEPALEYYKKSVEKDGGVKLTADNFLDVAKSYPLGMLKYDGEIILRVPFSGGEENSLILYSEIPENSVLVIMKAQTDKLIATAGTAAEQAKNSFETKKKIAPSKALIVECLARALFLEDKFNDELKIIGEKTGRDISLFGFLSLGEIASAGDKYIDLHNMTIVIGMDE
ncbi:FIST C-terminal domain-containing protein [Candidatus Dependentiae bacterium]|nr:FIST C-terminal domain-containing protein [Candidatus Dependentiae bacterium]